MTSTAIGAGGAGPSGGKPAGKTPGFADYGLLFLLASIFGAAFMLITVAGEVFPPATIVALRLGLASGLFVIAMIWAGQRLPSFGSIWVFIALSAILGNGLPFFLVAWGQQEVGAGLAAILTSSTPIMALIVGQVFTEDEKFTLPKFTGVLLGFAGVIVLIGPGNLVSVGDDQLRQYALLFAALCYALNAFVLKKLARLPRLATIAAVMMTSFLIMLPFSLAFDSPLQLEPAFWPIAALVTLGLLSTGAGNLLRFEIVHRQGALFLTQLSYLIPPFGLFWAWLFLGEIPSLKIWIALMLILSGIFVVRWGEARASSRRGAGHA